ncbi:efflux RND transporter periplasmic adaptor subunit [Thalassomonas haliotis]|uniref:Efflux RND transporter periplasmic adaptor subunit n=1 Tax=Thalassomonas haliotis TaxID=485448 RepID=A0ABY7VGL0_9GAMM|nr:efflux RND transporter periplasmic adaptor subunit [Thalassomonas haliotis]WDE12658.1 efflux RND transporter periplasmic adaptor subunit [Thalassomonas haliotis]
MDTKIERIGLKKHYYFIFLGVFLIICTLVFNTWNQSSVNAQDITLATVKSNFNYQLQGVGKVKPLKVWNVNNDLPGRVVGVKVRNGQVVKEGDELVQLENTELELKKESLLYELELVQIETISLEQKLLAERIEHQSKVKKAQLSLKIAKGNYLAKKQLFDKGASSESVLTVARLDLEMAEFEVEREQELITTKKLAADARLKLMQAKLTRKQQEVDSTIRLLKKLRVLAPIAGVVTEVTGNYGSYINKGQKMGLISSVEHLFAQIVLPEKEIAKIKVGTVVKVSSSQGLVNAKVTLINPALKNGTVEIEAEFVDHPEWLKPELPIQATFDIPSDKKLLYVNAPVGISPNSQSTVYKLSPVTGMLNKTEVFFGRLNDGKLEVVHGLTVNDVVVVSSQEILTGDDITLIREAS